MIIAKSPVLTNGVDRRQVVLDYNEKPGEFRIAVSSLYKEGDNLYAEDGSGLYTRNERRAQFLFIKNWECFTDCGYMIDQDNHRGERMMDELLNENGVFYTHDKSVAPSYYVSFTYGCMYKGKIVDNKTVYVKNANDFVKLIKYWNTKDSNWLFIL